MNRIEKQQDVLRRYHFKKVSENENEILYEKPIPFDAIDNNNAYVCIRVSLFKDYEEKKKINPKSTSYTLYYLVNTFKPLRECGIDVAKIDRLIETLLLQLGAIEDESI
jgi:hypothetical protein